MAGCLPSGWSQQLPRCPRHCRHTPHDDYTLTFLEKYKTCRRLAAGALPPAFEGAVFSPHHLLLLQVPQRRPQSLRVDVQLLRQPLTLAIHISMARSEVCLSCASLRSARPCLACCDDKKKTNCLHGPARLLHMHHPARA